MSQLSSFPDQPCSLADYGWDEACEHAFTPHRAAGLIPARIVRAERGSCEAVTDDGILRVRIPATDDHGDALPSPCTGDWAALRPAGTATGTGTGTGGAGDGPVLHTVLERRTALVRSTASRTSHGQVLAANVDTVVVTVSLAAPLKHDRTERMLALAWESGAQPVVVLTKADQCADAERAAAEVAEVAPGVDVLVTSAVTGQGLDTLTAFLHGTVALLGPSGAGKSTLGNRLLGEDRLATGSVRDVDGKGRHTTAWRELLPLPGGGVLLDTPGLRAIGLHDTQDGLEQTFTEIERLAQDCRFTDCAHVGEPGCAVLAAVAADEVPQRRLDSYHRLLRESAYAASRTDARLRAGRDSVKKDITRHLRATYEFRERQL
ncbi:ribosome small subunit-dependent GTPase A [Streptomyces paludis]|uniref:Small ribosomal subunit biogenesis GTPase RsgA n=1 Tax=Streptomyces paludis TaxID=2282738 RepID=A0A345HWI6_9ACTN|nr:ribosome small subunit-dependent GTPase A [Streptomyces paludis]AXG81060.1 ribosome small subunit-dependent GTPase A [Streptomyces paludis]